MPTTTKLTPTQFREELLDLLRLAAEYAALESRIESKAIELEESQDWEFDLPHFMTAVYAEVSLALNCAKGEHGHSDYTALQLCQDVQDAIDVLTFAIERDDRRGDDNAR